MKNNLCRILIIFFVGGLMSSGLGQTHAIDSLKKLIGKTAANDSNRVYLLSSICWQLKNNGNYDSAKHYAIQMKALAETIGFKKGITKAFNNFGNIELDQGNYPEAMNFFFKALHNGEACNDKKGAASALNNLGNVCVYQKDYLKALEYYLRSAKLKEEIGEKNLTAMNIGMVYFNLKNFKEALFHYSKALALYKEEDYKPGLIAAYNNVGNVYKDLEQPEAALEYYKQAYDVCRETGDKQNMAASLMNIGLAYAKQKRFAEAEQPVLKGLELAAEMHDLDNIKEGNSALSEISIGKGDFKKALLYYKAAVAAGDSLVNEANTKESIRLEMNYEFGKKEAVAKLEQEKREAVAAAESKKQKIIIYSICGILVLVAAFAVFAYRSYLQKQKANTAITKQKEIIEEKQREILDSIHYAQKIQRALITNERYIEKALHRLTEKD